MATLKDSPYYYERDKKKKTAEWGGKMISAIRGEWGHIIDKAASDRAMDILNSKQDLSKVKESFKQDSEWTQNQSFVPIAIFERITNILTAEYLKSAYTPSLEAEDLASTQQKQSDLIKLHNRSMIEGPLSMLNARVGNPPYKLGADKFKTNIQEFDKLGLDSDDEADVHFFGDNFQKLWHEVTAQTIMRYAMKSQRFERNVEKLVKDILGRGAVAYQVWASPYDGEIKWKYLDPTHVKAIKGESNDFSDAMAMGYEKDITVRQFLEFAGPGFVWSRDGKELTKAVNMTNSTAYVYVNMKGCYGYDDKGSIQLQASFQQLLQYTVRIGYCEFKSYDGVAEKVHKKSGFRYDIDYSEDLSESTEYEKREVEVYENTYKSWFLSTGYLEQMLIRWGPLYAVLTHGAEDEYSSFSIKAQVSNGKTAVQVGEQFVEVVNAAFYRMKWAIDKSTPRKRVYNYDAIVQLIGKLKQKNTGTPGQPQEQVGVIGMVNEVIERYTKSLNELYVIPKIDGQAFGGNQRLHYWDEGGIDPMAVAMQTVMDWAEAQVSSRIGVGALVNTETPDPKDGYRANLERVKQSRNATYYVPFMIQNVLQETCTCTLKFAQDSIKHKTKTYWYLSTLLGEEEMKTLRDLEEIPMHRYGFMVAIFNTEDKKEKRRQEAQVAYERAQITYAQFLMITELDDDKRAGLMLDYYTRKQEKEKAKAEAIMHQRQIEQIQAKRDAEISVIDRKGEWDVRREDKRGEYYMRAHQDAATADIQKKQMDHSNNAQKNMEKAEANIAEKRAQQSIDAAAPLPTATSQESVQSPAAEVAA